MPSFRRRALTVLAALLVFLALATPNQISRLPPGFGPWEALIRIPVEGVVAAALLIALPIAARRRVATVLGVLLGSLTVVKVIDMGFFAVLSRPFDPVLDWMLFDDAYRFLRDASGTAGAIGAVVAVLLLAALLVTAELWAVRRLAAAIGHRPRLARGTTAVAATAWVACVALAASFVPGVYVASQTAATLAKDTAFALPDNLADRRAFAAEAADDPYAATPLPMTPLSGKDTVFAFVESYGRSALEDPALAPIVRPVLESYTEKLSKAGFQSRSGWLTSPTAGGGSWLAHSTFQSGLWIDNEQRYRSLVASDRLTLTSAFALSGTRTVGVQPGITFAWPEGGFYRYDRIYDAHTLGYAGPPFSWSTMPDQFALESFARNEYAVRDRKPLTAGIVLTSSHTPWTHTPAMVGWDEIGDGRVFGPQVAAMGDGPLVGDAKQYAASVAYSLESLLSWVERYGDDDLVLIFLGDHQPSPAVTGPDASRDVPITVLTADPAVLDRAAGWGWQPGLAPAADAPVWRMDAFRDRFLAAFGGAEGH